ncbi:MAG: homocysteine S-methyltransferase family protein [Rhodospirillales bacterium]|nr:homocysteine S-methyltransferase family protein [Rhodospirillales bacterium]
MASLLQRLAQGDILISDGAMGTFLHAHGLGPGECPESWCLSHPDVVKGIAQAYVDAGADMVETNSFGASPIKLAAYGLAEQTRAINRAAASLAKQVIGGRGYVAASVGPTGHIAEDEGGDTDPAAFYAAFKEQALALAEGGADAICIETMASLIEAGQAVRAVKENTSLPVLCTFTFELGPRGFHTMMGVTPEQAAIEMIAAGADVVGTNCGNGIANMIAIVGRMKAAVPDRPILVHANAGMPMVENGKTVFKESPDYMASRTADLVKAGANIIGGCCGTTPEHIQAMARAVRGSGK